MVGLPWTSRCNARGVRGECSRARGGAGAAYLRRKGGTVGHGRREALEAAVEIDPGLNVAAVRLVGRPDSGE